MRKKLQSAIRAIYPPECLVCRADTSDEFGLCGACWADAPFITGLVCDGCGMPLPGQDATETTLCDSCLIAPQPWGKGRAVFLYRGSARRMILSLKHGDRQDLVRPMCRWLLPLTHKLAGPETLLVPVPLRASRLFFRRYNQAALLTQALARVSGLQTCPDALKRIRKTRPQEGMSRQARQENQRGAFAVPAAKQPTLTGRHILLVDDVMTSGATLAACAEACFAAKAARVDVIALARVEKT